MVGREGWVAGTGGRRDHHSETRNGLLLTEGGEVALLSQAIDNTDRRGLSAVMAPCCRIAHLSMAQGWPRERLRGAQGRLSVILSSVRGSPAEPPPRPPRHPALAGGLRGGTGSVYGGSGLGGGRLGVRGGRRGAAQIDTRTQVRRNKPCPGGTEP